MPPPCGQLTKFYPKLHCFNSRRFIAFRLNGKGLGLQGHAGLRLRASGVALPAVVLSSPSLDLPCSGSAQGVETRGQDLCQRSARAADGARMSDNVMLFLPFLPVLDILG